jgi:hypothetical protein
MRPRERSKRGRAGCESLSIDDNHGVASMKISFRDRIQAIKHSTIYLKDYQRYVKMRDKAGDIDIKIGSPWDPRKQLSKAGKRLCKKWGLGWPIAPDAPLHPRNCKTMELVADVPPWVIDGAVYPVSFPTEDELKNPSHVTKCGRDVVTHLNKKLCLLIDTSWPPDMIVDVLREFINHYILENKGNIKQTEGDPWKIYELFRHGKNLLEITRDLYGVTGQPAYDTNAAMYYRRVDRAYKKALKMIAYVEKEATQKRNAGTTPSV